MDIVYKLPPDLVRRVYSFGYAQERKLRAKINEIIGDWQTLVSMPIPWKIIERMNSGELGRLQQWSRFCRCCERHFQNRFLVPAFILPPNSCMCHCRQHIRGCINAKS